MSWFEFSNNIRNDPQVDNLRRSLRLAKAEAIGHLALFYAWCVDGRCFDGDLSSITPEQIAEASALNEDRAIDWTKALIENGFVSRHPGAPPVKAGEILGGHASIINWTEFCGQPTKKKIERRAPESNGIHMDSDPLEELLYTYKNSSTVTAIHNPVYSLLRVMKYVKKDKDLHLVKTDSRWDLLNKDRQLPWCKKILQSYEGDLKRAARAMLEIGEYFENLGFSWDASTVHKKLTDWEEGRLGQRN